MKLYHGSYKKIDKFISGSPMWFSSVFEDTKKAFAAQDDSNNGFIYQIDIDDFETTSDFMLFHGGEIFNHTNANVVKMQSNDIDNNWFVIKDINKFKIIQL